MSPVNSQDVFLASIPEVPSNTCKEARELKKKHKNNQEGVRTVLHKIMHQNAASQLENLISHRGEKNKAVPCEQRISKAAHWYKA